MSTTVTYQVAAGADDGYNENATFNTTGTNLEVGNGSGFAANLFARFLNVAVPQGATIISAKIQYKAAFSNGGSNVLSNIYANNVDNATSPTSKTDFDNKAATTNYVGWTIVSPWSGGTWYDSPDIKTVIQEIVNRSGWASGNALMIMHKQAGASNNWQFPASYESGAANAPKLVIEYAAGGTDVTVTAAVGEASAEALASIPHADVLVVGGIGEASAEALAANPTTALIVLGAVAEAVAEALPASPRADVLVQAEVAEATAEALPATALYNIHVTVLAATAEASAEALPAEPLAQRNITIEAAIGTATAEALAAVVRAGKKLYWVIKYL